MPHIFISYAKKDTRALAESLQRALKAIPSVTAWMDKSLEADESWALQIQQEIDRADYVIVLVSPDINRPVTKTQRRSFVLNEIDYAQQDHKPILPVLVYPAKLPLQIAGVQYIDLTANPTDPSSVVERVMQRFQLNSAPLHPVSQSHPPIPKPSPYHRQFSVPEYDPSDILQKVNALVNNISENENALTQISDIRRLLQTLLNVYQAWFDKVPQNVVPLLEKPLSKEASKFRVAFLGEFRSGRSSLINALVGADILPSRSHSGFRVELKYNSRAHVLLHSSSDRPSEEISRDKYNQLNPYDSAQSETSFQLDKYDFVEIFESLPFLADGLCLIDLPSLGLFESDRRKSLYVAHNSDCIVYVTQADRFMSHEDYALLRQLGQKEIIVVINKIDLISLQDLDDFKKYVFKRLIDLKINTRLVFFVSAEQALEAVQQDEHAKLVSSGIIELRNAINEQATDLRLVGLLNHIALVGRAFFQLEKQVTEITEAQIMALDQEINLVRLIQQDNNLPEPLVMDSLNAFREVKERLQEEINAAMDYISKAQKALVAAQEAIAKLTAV